MTAVVRTEIICQTEFGTGCVNVNRNLNPRIRCMNRDVITWSLQISCLKKMLNNSYRYFMITKVEEEFLHESIFNLDPLNS